MDLKRVWAAVACLALAGGVAAAEDRMLFDFENAADVAAWTNLDVYALREAEAKAAYDDALKKAADPASQGSAAAGPAKVAPYKPLALPAKEPAVKIEWTAEGAATGAHAMKLTFMGGRMPTVAVKIPSEDWRKARSFRAVVTAPRTCMVVFRVMTPTAKYGTSYSDGCSRWEFAARCVAGRNELATLPPRNAAQWNTITSLEIYVYNPREGESITVDSIALSGERPDAPSPFNDAVSGVAPRAPESKYRVAGTDLVVKDVDDLAVQLKDKWTKPADRTAAELEAEFRAEFDKLKAAHPRAVLVTLREGDKGCDPADPDKVFAGWQDAGTPSHLPMGLTLANFYNAGKSVEIETCFRNRPGFLRVDLSSLPKDAEVLAARLIVTRGAVIGKNWETSPTMFVVEPVNRPWSEYEVNVFEYSRDAFWGDYAAQTWGDGGDAGAVMLAHGPSAGPASAWDFAEAVKYWTAGGHANHGFILYGAPRYVDYLHVSTRECPTVGNRPAVMVVYEPK